MVNRILIFSLVFLFAGCASSTVTHTTPTIPGAHTTVVWISIDGFRHDYMARFHPPTLSRLAAEGAFTFQEMPIFPSLTFPNHVSQVTGVAVDGHGIPMNAFYDESTGQKYESPNQSQLLRAEPIWVTAQRQGVPTLCVDWPMSHAQTGPYKAAYFDQKFDTKETDRHRLDRILALLNSDAGREKPYRLIMGYMSVLDHMGHKVGPDAPEIATAIAEADQDVEYFMEAVIRWFNKTHSAEDELIFVFSTDHGMTSVKSLVNLDRLIGADLVDGATKIVTSGPVGTIHCAPERAQKIVDRLAAIPYLTAWKTADVPAINHFKDPTRIGQVVVMLKLGYTFSKPRISTTLPVLPDARGMHGYDPAESDQMQGSAVIWRMRNPMGGQDLGPMVNTQWDATVCRLLGIQPPAKADARAVVLR